MVRSLSRLLLAALYVAALSTSAFAQGSTGTITGTVVDSAGGVVPGATVSAKHNGTGLATAAVSTSAGTFAIPALNPGAYTVTVSLSGFKASITSDVRLTAGGVYTLKATLEVGALTESVTVTGGTELVQTSSPTISSTIDVDNINKLPLATRNALNYVTFLPGVETTGTARGSTVNGLP